MHGNQYLSVEMHVAEQGYSVSVSLFAPCQICVLRVNSILFGSHFGKLIDWDQMGNRAKPKTVCQASFLSALRTIVQVSYRTIRYLYDMYHGEYYVTSMLTGLPNFRSSST